MRTAIQVYCKAPIPGAVKTRLVPDIGVVAATELHARLAIESVLDATKAANALDDCEVQLWCAPDTTHEFFHQFGSEVSLHLQQGNNLGERMLHGVLAALRNTPDQVLVIGTDCPPVDAEYLASAATALMGNDAVIAPAEDGGYGLLGLTRVTERLFTDIDWGSDKVFVQTKSRLEELGYQWQCLPEIWDVDRAVDVDRYFLG